MDQLTLPFPQTDVPTVESAYWSASVCHRIVLADHRVVYLHYAVTSYQADHAPFTLETVTVYDNHGVKREDYDLADHPWNDKKADELPRWLHLLIQSTPEPRPIRND